MTSRKMHANIYYGTMDYLKSCMDRLISEGVVSWYAAIEHKGERQYNKLTAQWVGDRDKDHIHVGVYPNGSIQFDKVYGECMQLIGGKLTGFTRMWEPVRSRMDFWLYLYHDKDYLKSKDQTREYNYSESDIVCSDDDIKRYELFNAREVFWAQHGISHEVQNVVKGRMKESEFFARHIRDAYGADKLLRVARAEVGLEVNRKDGVYGDSYLRQIAFA